MSDRSRAPVFVIGSPRSGTTLLYHTLLSAGGFAHYRAETHVMNTLGPACGDLRAVANRERLLSIWLGSRMHVKSGLTEADVRALRDRFSSAGAFLKLVMDLVTARQGAQRWAETTPVHVLQMPAIKAAIPDALFVHVIRDGRDVAHSLTALGWVKPLPWDREQPVLAAGASWDWIVRRGRADGRHLGRDYLEVRYEALVDQPEAVLAELSRFVAQPLDYRVIQANAVGSVARPNTSFPGQTRSFSGRWRDAIAPGTLATLEAMIGPTLDVLGYERAATVVGSGGWRRVPYDVRFGGLHWLKLHTPLGRKADLELFARELAHT